MNCILVRAVVLICLLLGACSRVSKESPKAAPKSVPIAIEVFLRTKDGAVDRLAASPVKVVSEDMLAEAVAAIADVARLHDGIPQSHFESFYRRLESPKALDGIVTDADGKVTVKGLKPSDYVVVWDTRKDETTAELFFWIVPVSESEGGKLFLSNHNAGSYNLLRTLAARPEVSKRLFAGVEQALGRKQFFLARTLAENASVLGDIAAQDKAKNFLGQVDRQEAADLRERAEEALARKYFDEARRLTKSADSLANREEASALFAKIDQLETVELALKLVRQAEDAVSKADLVKASKFAEMAQSVAPTDEGTAVATEIKRLVTARDRESAHKLLRQAEDAMGRKNFDEARRLARSANYLVEQNEVAVVLMEINRQESADRRRQAEAALSRKEFDEARRLAKSAQSLAEPSKSASLIAEINRQEVAELQVQTEEAIKLKNYDVANRLALKAKATMPDELKDQVQSLIQQILEEAGGEIRMFNNQFAVESVAMSPDGQFMLSGSRESIKLMDVATGRELWIAQEGGGKVAFSSDGRHVLAGGRDAIRLLDATTGRVLWRAKGGASSVALSPDGKMALSGNLVVGLKLWEASKGREMYPFIGDENSVKCVAFSPNGRYALSGGVAVVKLWDVVTGRELRAFRGQEGNVNSVVFSPDSRYALSGSTDTTVRLWDIESGKEIRVFRGHEGRVNSVAFNADGRYALSGSTDATVRLWDVATGNEIRSFGGHESEVKSIAYCPNGRFFVSAGEDKTLRFWQLPRESWQ